MQIKLLPAANLSIKESPAKCGAIQAAIRTAVPRMVCQTSLAGEFARNRNRAVSRPTGLSREHAGAGLVSDGITDDQSALITARWCLLVSVLETLQLPPVTLSEPAGPGVHVDVGHVTRAIRKAGDRVEQSRTDDIADLETGMVDTVPEGWQLCQPLVARVTRSEFIREDGVGHIHIQVFLAPVSNAHARAMSCAQRVCTCSRHMRRGFLMGLQRFALIRDIRLASDHHVRHGVSIRCPGRDV